MRRLGQQIVLCCLLGVVSCSRSELYCVIPEGQESDLLEQLSGGGGNRYRVHLFDNARDAFDAAPEKTGVLVLSDSYPLQGTVVTSDDIEIASRKSLRVFVEYPDTFGGVQAIGRDTLNLERIVVCDSLSESLRPMDLLSFNRCILNVYEPQAFTDDFKTVLVAAKVAGFDSAVYGLDNTPTMPVLLSDGENFILSTTRISQYAHSRIVPEARIKSLVEYIIGWVTDEKVEFKKWNSLIYPAYQKNERLASDARRQSIAKGVEWYYNGNFIVDKSWKENWSDLYIGDGTMPTGPQVPADFVDGDGNQGVLEGHMSTINWDGSQLYRYWMRADVQGESSYAFASASDLLGNPEYAAVADKLLDYGFREYRDASRNDPKSPSYGLLGWAITHKGNYYGDDNARFILGALGSAAFLNNHKYDREIAEAVVGNFRTSGAYGFRGCILYESEIQENGWKYFYNRELSNPHPHFEAWLWACYLWLYDQTAWAPLFERTKEGILRTIESYPDGWYWTNGIQQERARMILPLAWLYRVEPTKENRENLDFMLAELLKNQVTCGGIREELGDPSKSSFGKTPSNELYGVTEAPLIFDNGDPISDMLYTTNFAFVGLCEAAAATKDPRYVEALEKMNDFLIRIQVRSDEFKHLDGAWFRAFDYDSWDYWASNADAGWGAWSTLTGWIQSWIVGTQVLLEQNTSLWELLSEVDMSDVCDQVIDDMMEDYK